MSTLHWSYFVTPQHSGDTVARQLLDGKPCRLHRRAAALKSVMVISASIVAALVMTLLQ